MKLKKTLVVSFAAAMALAGGAGSAYAGEGAINNHTQVLSCDVIEIINPVILAADNNNIDCSRNYKEQTEIKKVTKVEKEAKFTFSPELEQAQGQGQGQGQGQETEQGQKQAGEQDQKADQKADQEAGQKAKLQD
ncbi:hypothetical protein ACFSJS_02335 [Streptomyces desertarenae]|uniref:Uncharacterized protein n=1 Tax=Streptomyces desertarenae TaxID=2666184 RepID=A0ABW4PDG1_9ACTN